MAVRALTPLHVVVPSNIDDPATPSGGNKYDRRVCDALRASDIEVREHPVGGDWPAPDGPAKDALTAVLADLPDGAALLIDGLIASAVLDVLVPHVHRLTAVVLMHLPLGYEAAGDAQTVRAAECDVLTAAQGIVVTSSWTRSWLLDTYPIVAERIHVAVPGTDLSALAPGTPDGGRLLCVGTVAPHKGHDVLMAALAETADLSWRLVVVGSLDRDHEFVERLRHQADASAIGDRIHFSGPVAAADVDRAYMAADLVVLPSHFETYGMAVTESLAHGVPVVATDVGGVAEALGEGSAGRRPGILVAPGDPSVLAAALRQWLGDAELRQQLRAAARQRRTTLTSWTTTADRVARAIAAAIASAPRSELVMTDGYSR